jgi:Flp pilus assembly protein TadD
VHDKRQAWAYGLLLLLLTAMAYAPSLGFGFVWDDLPLIVENPLVQDPQGPRKMFFRNFWDVGGRNDAFRHFYRPMVSLSYWVDARFCGLEPYCFHLSNLLLHLAATGLVFGLAWSLLKSGAAAFAAAAFFALHPTHVENVTWVSGRTDLMAAVPGLAALACWLQADRRGRAWLWPAAGLYLSALLAKEVALLFPLAWLLWPLPRRPRGSLWQLSPLRRRGLALAAAAAALYFALRLNVLGVLASNTSFPSWGEYLPALGWVLFSYLRLAVTGLLLAPHYSDVQFHLMRGSTALVGWAFLLGLTAAGAWVLRLGGLPARALALALLFLLPVFSLGSFGDVLYADRFLYLPSLGLGLLGAWGLQGLWARWPPPPAWRAYGVFASAGLLAVLALGMVVRTSLVWRDNVTLFEQAAITSPRSVLIWNNLGLAYTYAGRYEEAEMALRRGLSIDPRHAYSMHNLGVALRRQGRTQEALGYLERALAREPQDSLYAYNLAEAYAAAGLTGEAEALYRRSLHLRPDRHEARHNLGYLLLQAGRLQQAEPLLQEAAAKAVKPGPALNSLGILAVRQGRVADARRYFEQALRADPALESPLRNLQRLDQEAP